MDIDNSRDGGEEITETRERLDLKISPTAYAVTSARVFAEIDHAGDIYEELKRIKAVRTPKDVAQLEKMKMPDEFVPFFEARYKLVNKLLAKNKSNQILEIAAGLSPRGISMTEVKYVELDLEAMTAEKEQINQALIAQGRIENRKNHYLETGDALDIQSLRFATRHFDKKPIAVVNEGLLRYLTFEQKAQYAKNVAALLKEFGGVWITPDITFKGVMKAAQARTNQFSNELGININIDANLFENEAEARKFFENLGFIIEVHPFREIENELISPKKLGISPEMLNDLIAAPVVYVMRLKPE